MLRAAKRRPAGGCRCPNVSLPEPTRRRGSVARAVSRRVARCPLEGPPGPEARYETKEAISLAFVTALQLLPARQRAVLILRDVLGFHASEIAGMLDSRRVGDERAQARTGRRSTAARAHEAPPSPELACRTRARGGGSPHAFEAERHRRHRRAPRRRRVGWRCRPLPLEYQGIALARRFHTEVTFRHGRWWRVVPAPLMDSPRSART